MPAVGKKEINYPSALVIAEQLQDRIEPLCSKFSFAGSLRRKQAYVGDIEIVCLPRFATEVPAGEMFPKPDVNLVVNHLQNNRSTNSRGYYITKGGDRYHQLMYAGVQVDLFMPLPGQWGRILALRTGPDSYSIKLASRWKQMGYKGHNGELIRLRRDKDGNRVKPEFPTEKSFFAFLGRDYVEPENRG